MSRLELADAVGHVDALAREPMVAAHPCGALFVTGYWDSVPPLWRSTDRGKSSVRVAVGTTWRWTQLSDTPLDDRPWLEVIAAALYEEVK